MTIHGLDGEGTPQHLSMSKKERTGTFAVRDGLNASAVVVYDYSKVCGQPRGQGHTGAGGGSGDGAELDSGLSANSCWSATGPGVTAPATSPTWTRTTSQGWMPSPRPSSAGR